MDLQFKFQLTGDLSPTLRIGEGEKAVEPMHNLGGAFSETVYIYGQALECCFENGFEPRILSIGLGLGYIEILTVAVALQRSRRLDPENSSQLIATLGGESFELIPELRNWFGEWALGNSSEVPIEFREAYETILSRTSQYCGIGESEIRRLLQTMLQEKRWLLKGALDETAVFDGRFGCICFDAFSSRTSPGLWSEEFLSAFISKTAAQSSVLSSYACTSVLKRTLVDCGFLLNIRKGFSNKRDSTFAVRGKSRAFPTKNDP